MQSYVRREPSLSEDYTHTHTRTHYFSPHTNGRRDVCNKLQYSLFSIEVHKYIEIRLLQLLAHSTR